MKEFKNVEHISFEKAPKAAQELILDVLYGRVEGYILQHLSYINTNIGSWVDNTSNNLFPKAAYRVIKDTVKPSINWDHVHTDYNYLAEDMKGYIYLYSHRPSLGGLVWCKNEGVQAEASSYSSLQIGGVDWKDSLIVRPGHEEG